jgi:hypothetical protein
MRYCGGERVATGAIDNALVVGLILAGIALAFVTPRLKLLVVSHCLVALGISLIAWFIAAMSISDTWV